MWWRRYDRRMLIGIGVVYFILIVGGLIAGLVYRAELGQLIGDIQSALTPSPIPGG